MKLTTNTVTGSGKQSRRREQKFVPTSHDNLRAWRIGLIRAAWQRVMARSMAEEEIQP